MRTERDAVRSLARYMSRSFGDEWEVTFMQDEGTFKRPGIRIVPATTVATGSSHTAELIMPVVVYAYPAEGDTIEDGFDNAMAAKEQLWQTFFIGVEEGRPMRVPLYDFDGTPIDEGSILRRYPDFMRVLDCSIQHTQAPEDETKWTAFAEIRLGWRRAALLPSGTRLAQQLKSNFDTTPNG